MRHRDAIVAAAVALALAANRSDGAARVWQNTTGGPFDTPANWVGGLIAGVNDVAQFTQSVTTEVWFDTNTGDRATASLQVTGGNVTFRRTAGPARTYTVETATITTGGRMQVTDLTFAATSSLQLQSAGRLDINSLGALAAPNVDLILGATGSTALSEFNVLAGGTATTKTGQLGVAGLANAQASVTGAGAAWTVNQLLTVGAQGNGTLAISAGGVVTNNDGVIGAISAVDPFNGQTYTGNGTVTVGGTGSVWENKHNLTLGAATNGGTGSLTLSAGARVFVGDSANNAVLNQQAGYVYVGDGSANASDGGLLSVYAGNSIQASGGLSIALQTTERGRVLVSGTNATLNMSSGNIVVGGAGIGTLELRAGALATTREVYATLGGGQGTITIDGAGTTLKATRNLTLATATTGTGSITTSGGGIILVGDLATSAAGVFDVSDAQVIGDVNSALVSILHGSSITHAGTTIVANGAGKFGRILLSGNGSTLTNGGMLQIGRGGGTGDLTIQAGADVIANNEVDVGMTSAGTCLITGVGSTFQSNGLPIVGKSAGSVGTMTVSAGGALTSSNELIMGYFAGSTGTTNVTDAGSTVSIANELVVGLSSTGAFNVAAGGVATAKTVSIGRDSGGVGTVSISGAGSRLRATGNLSVGTNGVGTLTTAADANVFVGDFDATGAGTAALVVSDVDAGGANGGVLSVAHGSTLNHNAGSWIVLGFDSGQYGRLDVTGAGSTVNDGGDLVVGRDGAGVLNITAGGRVNVATDANSAVFGQPGNGAGTTVVDGANSRLAISGNLALRNSSLKSTNAALVSVGNVAAIAATPGQLTISGNDANGAGGGTVNVYAGGVIENAGTLAIGPDANGGRFGRLIVGGANARVTNNGAIQVGRYGTLDVQEGALVVANNTPTISLTITNGGKVNLTGGTLNVSRLNLGPTPTDFSFTGGRLTTLAIIGDLKQTGGVLAPGGSGNVGSTSISGSYAQLAGALEVDVIGAAADSVNSGIIATPGGELRLIATNVTAPLGTSLTLISTNLGVLGRFMTVAGVSLDANRSLAVTYDLTTIRATLALPGDATLSSGVEFNDLLALAKNYGGGGKTWIEGDFDGTGTTDFNDLLILAKHYGQSGAPVPAGAFSAGFAADFALAQSLVPEPTMVTLVPLIAVVLRRAPRSISRRGSAERVVS